jgi:glycosyltransferase involved in cell wall biosynthesis
MRFDRCDLDLTGDGTFRLFLGRDIDFNDNSLVIDLYNLENSVHPEGHIGWWKFALWGLPDPILCTVCLRGDDVICVVPDAEPVDSWVNDEKVPFRRVLINAVLRSNLTNAIVHLDKIPGFTNKSDLSVFRAGLNRNWSSPRFAVTHYMPQETSTVHIVSHNIFQRDAVGNLCLDVFRLLKQNGIPVRMYAAVYDLSLNDIIHRSDSFSEHAGAIDQLLYFHSTYDPVLENVLSVEVAKRVAYFHGITRPELLHVFDPELATHCGKAYEQVVLLRRFDVVAANSRASASVLIRHLHDSSMLEEDIEIIPPRLLSPEEMDWSGPIRRSERTRLLYVGRIKSHKKIEDLLELFSAYLTLDPSAEMWIAGGGADKAYRDYLEWVQAVRLKLPASQIHWMGSISDADLKRCYEFATAYVSMSEDEGFCLPIHQAMLSGVPVFAYGVPAIRELMVDTGLYFLEKDYQHIAATMHRTLGSEFLSGTIVRKQRRRALEIANNMDGSSFLKLLEPKLGAM